MLALIKRFFVELVNLLFALVIALLVLNLIWTYLAQPFQVEGRSMNPTLYQADHLLMVKHFKLDRFDIIVFPDPMGSDRTFVKRVIGLPGDRLEVKDDQLLINGIQYSEPYLDLSAKKEEPYTQDFTLWETTGDDFIPAGKVFVMGDNRPHSGDSRQFGYVDINSIEGEANFIYLPLDRFGKLQIRQQ